MTKFERPETLDEAMQLVTTLIGDNMLIKDENERLSIKIKVQERVLQDQLREFKKYQQYEDQIKKLENDNLQLVELLEERKKKYREQLKQLENKQYRVTELENDLWKANNTIESLRYKQPSKPTIGSLIDGLFV